MTVVVLDGGTGPLPPYPGWLRDAGDAPVLLTGRAPAGVVGAYAEVRSFPGYATAADVERCVLDLARRGVVSAIVATATTDLVRAGALRDHLGLPGQGRDGALAFADPVQARRRLLRAAVPAVPVGEVRRVSDLYWYAARWGYPLRIRRRREPPWPTVAVLRDEADVRAFCRGDVFPTPEAVPRLLAEPAPAGERRRVGAGPPDVSGPGGPDTPRRLAVAAAARAALPGWSGYPYAVDLVRAPGGDWLVDTTGPDLDDPTVHRAAVRAQAGLPAREREVTG